MSLSWSAAQSWQVASDLAAGIGLSVDSVADDWKAVPANIAAVTNVRKECLETSFGAMAYLRFFLSPTVASSRSRACERVRSLHSALRGLRRPVGGRCKLAAIPEFQPEPCNVALAFLADDQKLGGHVLSYSCAGLKLALEAYRRFRGSLNHLLPLRVIG